MTKVPPPPAPTYVPVPLCWLPVVTNALQGFNLGFGVGPRLIQPGILVGVREERGQRSAFYGTQRFITAFTTAHHLPYTIMKL